MFFGLTNAPSFFQHLMNDVFRKFLDYFAVVYLNNIMIFSKDEKDDEQYVRLVLRKLHEAELYVKLENCVFDQSQVEFQGYIISDEGLSMDPKKIQTMIERQKRTTISDVQYFFDLPAFMRSSSKTIPRLLLH